MNRVKGAYTRHLRVSLLVASLLTACGGSVQTPAAPASPSPEALAFEPPTTPASPAADATPDPYRADDSRDTRLAKAASAVLEAFANSQPWFTRDGKKVVFTSDRDGLPQLYLADAAKPDAPATRLLTTSERMAGPLVTPDGKSVIFLSDKGADEHWTIFRVDLDGRNLVELTPARLTQRPRSTRSVLVVVGRRRQV